MKRALILATAFVFAVFLALPESSVSQTRPSAIQIKDKPYVDAREYGVKTSLSDVSTTLQAALDSGKDVYVTGGVYRIDPTVGVNIATNGQRLFGDGGAQTIFWPSSTATGSIVKRAFDAGGTNAYIEGVRVEGIGVVLDGQGQVAFDFRNIGRSEIVDCYAGTYNPGDRLTGVRTNPVAQASAAYGYGILFGNVSSSDPAYAGGERNAAIRCKIVGAKKGITVDESSYSPVSAAHATLIDNCEVQICEQGIAQESQYGAGNTFRDNTVQSVLNFSGSTATTAAYLIAGYNNRLEGGYTECASATTDYLVWLTSTSYRNYVGPFYNSNADNVFKDDGSVNRLEYFFPGATLSEAVSPFVTVQDGRSVGPTVKVAATFNGTGSFDLYVTEPNLQSIANSGTPGDYTLTIVAGVYPSNGSYPVLLSHVSSSALMFGSVQEQSTQSLRLRFYNAAGTPVAPDQVTVLTY